MQKRLIRSILSALLLALPWLVQIGGWSLFVAFVPLFILQSEKPRRFGLWVALTFLLWIALSAWWVANSTPIAAFAIPIVGLFFCWTPFMIYHYVWKRQPGVLAWVIFVTAWIAFEALYAYQDISFPWLTLGNGFAATPWMVQWYEYVGAFGGTLWVLIANILAYRIWQKREAKNLKKIVVRASILLMWIFLPILAFKATHIFEIHKGGTFSKVCIVQPNIDPYQEKFENGSRYMSQHEQAELLLKLAAESPSDVDFIVMPETALDDALWLPEIDNHPRIRQFREFIRNHRPGATIVVGATTYEKVSLVTPDPTSRGYTPHNSALWIDSTSHVEVYHKSKLVVGPELTPFPALFNLMTIDLGGVCGNYGKQEERAVYDKVGVAICYESIYGAYFTEYIDKGAEAMFVITNDGWWGDTQGHVQHLNYARLRAIETRRDIARSANTGISAIINMKGEILQQLGWWQRGVVNGEIRMSTERTFYAQWKDAIVRISVLTFALSLLYFAGQHFRNKLNRGDSKK